MDSDLIRKSRTLELLKYYERQYDGIGRAIRAFEQMETVDAVEVVRCKDCKYRDPEYGHCVHYMGTAMPLTRRLVDFCSYGEKMDGGKNDEN